MTVKHSSEKFLTVDVARMGGDKIVLTFWQGWKVYKVEWKIKQRIPETVESVRDAALREGIPWENVLIDDDGVGGGVVDYLPGSIGFVAEATPFGKVGEQGKVIQEQYANLKTQCCYHLSEMVSARRLQVELADTEVIGWLAEELPQYKRRDADRDGKLKITKKEDIKSALGRSPDFADTFIMRAYFDLRKREPALAGSTGVVTVHYPDMDVD